MICPVCPSKGTKCIDSKAHVNDAEVYRRRECLQCKHRFSTMESVVATKRVEDELKAPRPKRVKPPASANPLFSKKGVDPVAAPDLGFNLDLYDADGIRVGKKNNRAREFL